MLRSLLLITALFGVGLALVNRMQVGAAWAHPAPDGRGATVLTAAPPVALIARSGYAGWRLRVPPTAQLAAFVQTDLAVRVLIMEDALATANRAVLAYCPRSRHSLLQCADLAVATGGGVLATTLTQEAGVLAQASQGLSGLPLPDLGRQPTQHLALLQEDLVVCSGGLASLLQEVAAGVPLAANVVATASSAAYGPRVRDLVIVLRRAEGWVETVDRETGAHVRLPGFEPGLPLEQRLNMQ
jgi:hypothetical protein